jgi:hypothetical protein
MTQLYAAYRFTTKDPVIDELRTLLEDNFGGRLTRKMLKSIEISGGPTASTSANWFFGGVRRPQNPGIEATGRAMGYQRKWVKLDKEAQAIIADAAARDESRRKRARATAAAAARKKRKRNGG